MDFFDSPSCQKQLVCKDCRSIVDPTIRHQIAEKYGLDPEFACPRGFPMGSEMLPVTVAGRVPERIARAVPAVAKKERPAAKPPAPKKKLGPGSAMGAILKELGYKTTPGCGCAAFAMWMDSIGWIGCIKQRTKIIAWFSAKAVEAGTPITPKGVWKVVKQAMKHQRALLRPPDEDPIGLQPHQG